MDKRKKSRYPNVLRTGGKGTWKIFTAIINILSPMMVTIKYVAMIWMIILLFTWISSGNFISRKPPKASMNSQRIQKPKRDAMEAPTWNSTETPGTMFNLKMVRRIFAQKSTTYIFFLPMGYSFFIDLKLVRPVDVNVDCLSAYGVKKDNLLSLNNFK